MKLLVIMIVHDYLNLSDDIYLSRYYKYNVTQYCIKPSTVSTILPTTFNFDIVSFKTRGDVFFIRIF